jgi:hypothetical protein
VRPLRHHTLHFPQVLLPPASASPLVVRLPYSSFTGKPSPPVPPPTHTLRVAHSVSLTAVNGCSAVPAKKNGCSAVCLAGSADSRNQLHVVRLRTAQRMREPGFTQFGSIQLSCIPEPGFVSGLVHGIELGSAGLGFSTFKRSPAQPVTAKIYRPSPPNWNQTLHFPPLPSPPGDSSES